MADSKLKSSIRHFNYSRADKVSNQANVKGYMRTLRLIEEYGLISQAQAAKALGMTAPAALNHFRKLQEDDLIVTYETDKNINNGPGRPAAQWKIKDDTNYTIGIVFEPPLLIFGLQRFDDTLIIRKEYDTTDARTTQDTLAMIDDFMAEVYDYLQDPAEIRSCCACLPGPVNIPYFKPLEMKEHIFTNYGFDTVLTLLTAASSFGIAGEFPDDSTVAVIGWDLGISIVPCWNSQVLFFDQEAVEYKSKTYFHYGSRGLHDAAHMPVEKNGRLCRCGKRGCLEAYAGAWAMIEQINRPDIRKMSQLLHAAQNGDEQVLEVVQNAALRFGEMMSWLVPFLGVDRLVFSGPMAKIYPLFRNAFEQGLAKLLSEDDIRMLNPAVNNDPIENMIKGGCRAARHAFFNADLTRDLSLLPLKSTI